MKGLVGIVSSTLILLAAAEVKAEDVKKNAKGVANKPVAQKQERVTQVAMALPVATLATLPMLQAPAKTMPAPVPPMVIPSDHDRIRGLEIKNFGAAYP